MAKSLLLVAITLAVLFEGTRAKVNLEQRRSLGTIFDTIGNIFSNEPTEDAGPIVVQTVHPAHLDHPEASSHSGSHRNIMICQRSMLLDFLAETLEPLIAAIRESREQPKIIERPIPAAVAPPKPNWVHPQPANRQVVHSDEDSDATWSQKSTQHELYADSGEEVEDDDLSAIKRLVNAKIVKNRLAEPDSDNKPVSMNNLSPTTPAARTLSPRRGGMRARAAETTLY